jgi:hypothetical protein
MMPHMKKPPAYAEFVMPGEKPKPQSPEVLEAMCAALAAAWGAETIH